MRFINQQKGNNGGIKYHFFIGKEEMELLFTLIKHYKKNIPNTLLSTSTHGRLRNIEKELKKVIFKKEI